MWGNASHPTGHLQEGGGQIGSHDMQCQCDQPFRTEFLCFPHSTPLITTRIRFWGQISPKPSTYQNRANTVLPHACTWNQNLCISRETWLLVSNSLANCSKALLKCGRLDSSSSFNAVMHAPQRPSHWMPFSTQRCSRIAYLLVRGRRDNKN